MNDIGNAIHEVLNTYLVDVEASISHAANVAVEELAKETKRTAPVGTRRKKHYRDSITFKKAEGYMLSHSIKAIWYVKGHDYRLTHLLVHGHATKNGGRTKANPFLKSACDKVFPKFYQDVEKVVQTIK